MTKREQALLDYLHSPAVRLYTEEERAARALARPQTNAEAKRAEVLFPSPKARRDYRETSRTPEETEAILVGPAKEGARSTWCRTPNWIDSREGEIRWDLLAKELEARFGK